MENPTIAAVIPVFNRERLIADALKSVAGQTQLPHSLVVIDDGSTDRSAAVVEKFIEEAELPFPAKLIRQPNMGVGAARKNGVEMSRDCDLLAMLDSDDLWPVNYLKRMSQVFVVDSNVVGASCDRVAVDMATGLQTKKPSNHLYGDATKAIFTKGTSPSSATMIRMSAYRESGGYDQTLKFKDDVDLYLRVSMLGAWAFVPNLSVTLRRNTNAMHDAPKHLTEKSVPNRLEMVSVLERFMNERGGDRAIPARIWKKQIARLWFRLGRDYLDAGSKKEANESFRRATELNPIQIRAWWKRMTMGRYRGESQISQ